MVVTSKTLQDQDDQNDNVMKESQERDVFGKADRINRALNDILVGRK